jgi:hypothetical protein
LSGLPTELVSVEGKIGKKADAPGISALPTGLAPVEGKIGRKAGAPFFSILFTHDARSWGSSASTLPGGREDLEEDRRTRFSQAYSLTT